MRDTIQLRGLRVLGICGALPEEQVRKQPLEIDVDIVADLSRAAGSDALEDTIDYGSMASEVERVVSTERFVLLERVAQRICDAVLHDVRVDEVTVWVRKLRPPVPQQLDTSGVRFTRTRGR